MTKNCHKAIPTYLALFMVLILTVATCNLFAPDESGESTAEDDSDHNYENYVVSPAGGSHTFDSGISIDVPSGAVNKDTEIRISKLEPSYSASLLEDIGRQQEDVLVGFSAEPLGLSFERPVTITLPISLEPGTFLFFHSINLEDESFEPAVGDFYCDPAADEVSFEVIGFGSGTTRSARDGANAAGDYSGLTVEQIAENKRGEANCAAEPCKCGAYKATQTDTSVICQKGDCEVRESTVSIEYFDCEGSPVEESTFKEMSSKCLPEMTLTAESTELSPGESTQLTANISLACGTLEEQSVDFSIGGQGVVSPTNKLTDTAGNAVTTFTAGEEEGVSTVTANSTVSWYPSKVTLTLTGKEVEPPEESLRTESISETIDISVEEDEGEKWAGTLQIEGTYEIHGTLFEGSLLVNFTFELDEEDIGTFTTQDIDNNSYEKTGYIVTGVSGVAIQDAGVTWCAECCDVGHVMNEYFPEELHFNDICIWVYKDDENQDDPYFSLMINEFYDTDYIFSYDWKFYSCEFGYFDMHKTYCDLLYGSSQYWTSVPVYLTEGTQEYQTDTLYSQVVSFGPPWEDQCTLTLEKLD